VKDYTEVCGTWRGGPDLSIPGAYAGIGSRKTPPEVLALMSALAAKLATLGWRLRSGSADGADSAFERGADSVDPTLKEVFLPWDGFNGRKSDGVSTLRFTGAVEREAMEIAREAHPAWWNLSQGARRLHTRNVGQVLGPNLDAPSGFVVCWTERGAGKGGTGQAIRIATSRGVPVFDLGKPELLAAVSQWVYGPDPQ
jgi:hypothetical protein